MVVILMMVIWPYLVVVGIVGVGYGAWVYSKGVGAENRCVALWKRV